MQTPKGKYNLYVLDSKGNIESWKPFKTMKELFNFKKNFVPKTKKIKVNG